MIDFETWCAKHRLKNYASRQFNLPNGELYSAHFCEAQNHRRKTSIVFLHGTGNDAWFPQACLIESLTKLGFDFFSVQLPGHGRTDTSTLLFEHLGEFVEQAVTQIKSAFEVENFVLIGQSLGAVAIVQGLAAHSNFKGLSGLVLISMPLNPSLSVASALPEILLPIFSGFWRLTTHYGVLASIPAFGSFRRKEFPVRLDPNQTNKNYLSYICSAISREPLRLKLQNTKIPLLAIYAEHDRIAPPKDGALLKSAIPHLNFEVVKSENHFSIMGSVQLPIMINDWIHRHEK